MPMSGLEVWAEKPRTALDVWRNARQCDDLRGNATKCEDDRMGEMRRVRERGRGERGGEGGKRCTNEESQ